MHGYVIIDNETIANYSKSLFIFDVEWESVY